jgi:hypothetical protein
VDGGDSTDEMLLESLTASGIPLLLLYNPTRGAPTGELLAEHKLAKPFVDGQLLDGIARVLKAESSISR